VEDVEKMTDETRVMTNAMALASYAISVELLKIVVKSPMVQPEHKQAIFDQVLLTLETLPLPPSDPSVQIARQMIEVFSNASASPPTGG
jgi:hypothetical protein